MIYYKICFQCGKKKQLTKHFYPNHGARDGYKNVCKSCLGVKVDTEGLIPAEIISLMSYHQHNEVRYFGYFLGYIIRLRKGEFLAYSILGGSCVFVKSNLAKAWLCQGVVKAAKIIERGLTKRLNQY